jgi:hypothetical protein
MWDSMKFCDGMNNPELSSMPKHWSFSMHPISFSKTQHLEIKLPKRKLLIYVSIGYFLYPMSRFQMLASMRWVREQLIIGPGAFARKIWKRACDARGIALQAGRGWNQGKNRYL